MLEGRVDGFILTNLPGDEIAQSHTCRCFSDLAPENLKLAPPAPRVSCGSSPAIRSRLRLLFPPLPVFHSPSSVDTAAAGHFPGLRPEAAADPTAPWHSSPFHRSRSELAPAQFPECVRPSHSADKSVSVEKLISRLARFLQPGPARCWRPVDLLAELRSAASRSDWTVVGAPPAVAV